VPEMRVAGLGSNPEALRASSPAPTLASARPPGFLVVRVNAALVVSDLAAAVAQIRARRGKSHLRLTTHDETPMPRRNRAGFDTVNARPNHYERLGEPHCVAHIRWRSPEAASTPSVGF